MRRSRSIPLLCIVISGPASAAAPETPPSPLSRVEQRLQNLEQRIESLRTDARTAEISVRRAREIESLVLDVLADAESRASTLGDGLTAGYDGAAFLSDPAGRVALRLWGFIQVRYTYNHRAAAPDQLDSTDGFGVHRTRLFVDGRIDEITFRIRTTLGSNGRARLDQAYAQVPVGEAARLRIGQFMVPLIQDEWIGAQNQLAVNQSVTNSVFGQGQSQGLMLQRSWETVRIWAAVTDGIRTANTPALSDRDAEFALTGRVEHRFGGGDWARYDDFTSFPGEPFGGLLGVALHYENRRTGADATGDLLYVTGVIGLGGDGWNLTTYGVVTQDDAGVIDTDATTDFGWVVQGGVFVAPRLELYGRYEWIEGRGGADDDPFRALTLGGNWYLVPESHRLKLSADVIYFFDGTEGTIVRPASGIGLLPSAQGGQFAVQAQLQLIF